MKNEKIETKNTKSYEQKYFKIKLTKLHVIIKDAIRLCLKIVFVELRTEKEKKIKLIFTTKKKRKLLRLIFFSFLTPN